MKHLWWQRGIVYQVYPRSFMDANGDGIGDLAGIISRLDYLHWLGVDALWLSPIYPSPMKDFGYDVSDYTAVDPRFGTLADFDRLVEAAHARGLKLILDFVPNHTSDQHAWFRESRASRDNPKRDWYLWRDPAPGGGPPNNWLSCFGGSAWQLDPATGQYYYHAFLPEQPDLNWRNPEVVEAMLGVLRFWLERGVDGFRVDVLWHLVKDEHFGDNPPNTDWREGMDPYHALVPLQTTDRPEVHDIVRRMRRLLDEYRERVLIGEIYLPLERLMQYYGADLQGAHLPFNFQLLSAPWDAAHLAGLIAEYERLLPEGAWPNWVLGNHDRPRIASRVGPAQARVAAMLLLTLRGTPTIYYGDELGMRNVSIPPVRCRIRSSAESRDWAWVAIPYARRCSGAPRRRPASRAAGRGCLFHPTMKSVNVAAQRQDPKSMLALYTRLIALRRAEPALQVGSLGIFRTTNDVSADVLTYFRGDSFLVALNLGGRPRRVQLARGGAIVLSSHLDRAEERVGETLELRPDEGLILRLTN